MEPQSDRPYMPEYGIADEKGGKGLLPWSWAQTHLESANYYWIGTTRPDGRPHSMPVWAVLVHDVLYFSSGRRSRKSQNLAANSHCVVSIQRDDDAVIVEGVATEVEYAVLAQRVSESYKAKYKSDLDPKLGPIFAVHPKVVIGLIGTANGEADASDFTGTATRWKF